MFTRLLVGVDGSAGSEAALTAAIGLARRFRGSIVLAAITDVRVLEAPLLETTADFWTGALPAAPISAQLGGVMHERAGQLLEEARSRVQEAGLQAETVRAVGRVDEELIELADRAEALVVGRRGEAHERPGTIGEVTAHLVKRYPKPVVVAGDHDSAWQKPVVAYDGGETSSSALALAARYAGATGVSLSVVHVSNDAAAGEALLARAGAFLSGQGVAYETHRLSGEVTPAIEAFIERTGADLLVAGAHGGRRRSWGVGSHTEQLLRATAVPVIVHR
jgi:nucleotide-binding universal stress UspA family protein